MARTKRRSYTCFVCGWTGYASADYPGSKKTFCPACRQRGVQTDMRAGELARPRRKKGPVGRTSVVRGDGAKHD